MTDQVLVDAYHRSDAIEEIRWHTKPRTWPEATLDPRGKPYSSNLSSGAS